jgi:hypothetical protein
LKPEKQRWFVIRIEQEEIIEDTAQVSSKVQTQKEEILQDFVELRAKRKLQLDVLDAELAKTDQTG